MQPNIEGGFMQAVFVLRIIACICLFFASFGGLFEPARPYAGNIGWAGLFFFVLSFMVT
jgi:hypothetical protein